MRTKGQRDTSWNCDINGQIANVILSISAKNKCQWGGEARPYPGQQSQESWVGSGKKVGRKPSSKAAAPVSSL